MDKPVRTRIAPSPTGNLHVGTARAALFNELFARQHNGVLVVRIEDTDAERSKPLYEQNILEGLKWLGIEWQEGPDLGGDFGPYRQSERGDMHKEAIAKLLKEDAAYQNEGEEAVYLRVTDREVTFPDLVRGKVTTPTEAWGGDFVIARTPIDPVFHLAVVVDDAAMEISHVIRGEDHVSNTARHILLQRVLGYETPSYAHLPLLLDDQRKKLSKRSGETDLLSYRDQGYLPEAMLNYLALLGWNPKTDQELLKHDELIEKFKLADVHKGGAIFSLPKLMDLNKEYLKRLSAKELVARVQPWLKTASMEIADESLLAAALATEQERVSTLAELPEAIRFFLPDGPGDYAPSLLVWRKSDIDTTKELLAKLVNKLESIDENEYRAETLEQLLLTWIDEEELGRGDTLWPMRVALTGQENSPGPFEVAAVLGKTATIDRINKAIKRME